MKSATGEMEAIRAAAGSMLPEDRVARTMDLQEDIAAKMEVLKEDTNTELDLLPQGSDVPKDAQVSHVGDGYGMKVGAASKGIIQRDFQHNAMVYKSPYAKNPFDMVSNE